MVVLSTILAFLPLIQVALCASIQLGRTGWTATADSFNPGNEPAKALDGDATTFWHSAYAGTVDPLPNVITIDMKASFIVSGVSITPRQDDSSNGNIGQHTIELSTDGTNWGATIANGRYVASGTWADDGSEKVAQFRATARYFRLNALSEAGNRGNWSSAAEVNMISTVAPTYTAPSPSKGLWQNTVDFPIVPAAAAMLPNGKVLLWSSFALDNFGGTSGFTQTAIYDPATGVVTPRTVTNTQHDMFCPGISATFDGRIVVTGGDNAAKTSIYDYSSDAWIPGPDMKIARGYQSTAIASDGRIFNIGGSWSGGNGGKNGEIWNPSTNTWSLLQNALVAPMLTADRAGVYRADNHGWLFGWKNGSIFQAGPSKAMNWYSTSGAGGTTGAGLRSDDGDAMNGNAIMFDAVAGKILTAGGATNYQTDDARTNAYVITIGAPNSTPSVTKTASMSFARGFANGIVLPDGTVFVTGGQSHVEPFTDTTAALTPELYNPSTGAWTQLNPMSIPRTYHSVGLLLPDATVLNGGGGLCGNCGTNHWDAEIFVPPYLLNADGSRRSRPSITSVASTVALGKTLGITTGGAVARFALVRLGTSTHTVDTDQRRVPLTASGSGTSWSVVVPGDAGVVVPGYWYLFAIDGAGTPSLGKVIRVTPS
ncbi:galactose oxidase [Polyplosphaeria fusca]|uniref:Galactose oxidase n=1 Tax=Polyplosphaeria fusca TaxID=682080 RepID=A0A9P4UY72_9PLEO|nr:galactose oxidase [Polyplosphaeria fusca]